MFTSLTLTVMLSSSDMLGEPSSVTLTVKVPSPASSVVGGAISIWMSVGGVPFGVALSDGNGVIFKMRNVRIAAGRKIVDNRNFVVLFDKLVRQVAADKSGTAGDENFHKLQTKLIRTL